MALQLPNAKESPPINFQCHGRDAALLDATEENPAGRWLMPRAFETICGQWRPTFNGGSVIVIVIDSSLMGNARTAENRNKMPVSSIATQRCGLKNQAEEG